MPSGLCPPGQKVEIRVNSKLGFSLYLDDQTVRKLVEGPQSETHT